MRDPKVVVVLFIVVFVVVVLTVEVVGRESMHSEISTKVKDEKPITESDLRAVLDNPDDYSKDELRYVFRQAADLK